MPAKSIESAFNKWWPELEKELQEVNRQSAAPPDRKKRTEMDVLEEVLDTVRQLSRDTQLPTILSSLARAWQANPVVVASLMRMKEMVVSATLPSMSKAKALELEATVDQILAASARLNEFLRLEPEKDKKEVED